MRLSNPTLVETFQPNFESNTKIKNHPNIAAIRDLVYKEIKKLNPRKSAQSSDFPIRNRLRKTLAFLPIIFMDFTTNPQKLVYFHPF